MGKTGNKYYSKINVDFRMKKQTFELELSEVQTRDLIDVLVRLVGFKKIEPNTDNLKKKKVVRNVKTIEKRN